MDNKAKINARNEDEDTSLHLAAKNGKIRYTHSNLKKNFFHFQVLVGIYFFGLTIFCYACFKYSFIIIVVIEVALLRA